MAGFLLLPNSLDNSPQIQKALSVFNDRGFNALIKKQTELFSVYYFDGLGGRKSGFWQNENGDFICLSGTCLFDSNLITNPDKKFYDIVFNSDLSNYSFSGAFCILAYRKSDGKLILIHDENSLFRFYINTELNIISSSFLSLAEDSDPKDLNKEIISFNLVFGFLPARKTWIQKIERVLDSSQIPEGVEYKNVKRSSVQYSFSGCKEAVKRAAELLLQKTKIKTEPSQINFYLGLSSGYDSRLMAALLHKNDFPFNFFTFNKPGDLDPVIAQKVSEYCKIPLAKKQTERVKNPDLFEEVFSSAFKFFDGQAVNMMQYTKPDYTAGFRKEIFSGIALHFSGVGGEIFRNYNYDHKLKCSVESWIDSYLLNGFKLNEFVPSQYQDKILNIFKDYISAELGIINQIDYKERKVFYSKLLLRDWHSVRNSIENQYSYYYTPFTDPEVIELSLQTIQFHGTGGYFEGRIIDEVNTQLASIDSSYGHALNTYPFKNRLLNAGRAVVKTPFFSSFNSERKKASAFSCNEYEKSLINIFKEIGLEINSDNLLKSSRRVEPLLATAYSLKKILNS